MPLPETQVAEVIKLLEEGRDARVIADELGVPFRNIVAIKAAQAKLKNQRRRRRNSLAGFKAAATRRRMTAWEKAHAAEAASKAALGAYCEKHGWKFAFFEGKSGSPRTGIIDAIAWRLGRKNSDLLNVQLIQLKGGNAGVSGKEIKRLKDAAAGATVNWLIAEFDGETLHLLPGDPIA
jgi:hypothetical protein